MPQKPAFESYDEGARLRRLSVALEDPRWILTGIGALLESASQRAFREERMGAIKWKTRDETGMVPNWPAILAHFAAKSTAPPNRNFHAKNTLIGTGRLAGSIKSRVVGEDTVEVGTNVPYGKALHEGGESETVKITEALQNRMWDWMKKVIGRSVTKKGKVSTKASRAAKRYENAKAKYGADSEKAQKAGASAARASKAAVHVEKLRWLLNKNLRGEQLTVKHPKRPLVGLPPDTAREIEKRYGARVRRVSA